MESSIVSGSGAASCSSCAFICSLFIVATSHKVIEITCYPNIHPLTIPITHAVKHAARAMPTRQREGLHPRDSAHALATFPCAREYGCLFAPLFIDASVYPLSIG